jgi:hypothetical protein
LPLTILVRLFIVFTHLSSFSTMSAPMSERQQMKLLMKQQKEEEEERAAAASVSDINISQEETRPRRASKTSTSQTKKENKKRSNSLAERKEAARQKAVAKQQEETSASEENAFTTSQEEDDDEEEPDYGDDDSGSDSEIEFIDDTPQKKGPPTRATRASQSRKRQLSEDMSPEDESNATKPKSRLKKKLSRKRTRQASTALLESDSDNDDENGSTNDTSKKQSISSTDKASASITKKGAIPKKKTTTIPKKGEIPRRKTAAIGEGVGDAKVSLLQNMAPGNATFHQIITSSSTIPPSSPSKVQQTLPILAMSKSPVHSVSSSVEAGRPRALSQVSSLSQSIPKSPTPQQPTPTMQRGMTPPPQTMVGGNFRNTQQQHPASLSIPPNSKEEREERVFDALGTMCDSLSKQDRFQIRSGPAIDMSGSFLTNDRYDFFDVDSRGDIMLQAKIPIFPEDFPPGKPEWPLSWWGIVDPALAPTPTIMEEVEPTTDPKEATVADKEWETRPETTQQRFQPPPLDPGLPPARMTGRPPPMAHPNRPPPSQIDTSGRGHFAAGRGGRGAPSWPNRGGAHDAGRRPPPLHGMPPPNRMQDSSAPPLHPFPPGGGPARGRGGMHPGDRPPPSRRDGNMRPPRGRY